MKKIFLAIALLIGATTGAFSQTKAVKTVKISLPTVQCEMSKTQIETYLKRYDGIGAINVNWKKKEATVKYLTDRITEEEIKAAIANVGYDANEITAEPDAYKRLPACCRKPATVEKKN
ncbi:MAG: heavy metal transporter [Flaviaesturariibacter sp.]|nr:heavy metal transporter [Flaviaesturariibacter sp.]